ncbi:hypothetical protein [Flavobacterium microcysteis]
MKKRIENFYGFQKHLVRRLKQNWPVLFVFCITSCTIQNKINRDGYKSIPPKFSGKFYDQLDTLHVRYDNQIFTSSLIKKISNIDNVDYLKPIQIDIKDKELFLSYSDARSKRHVLKFYGKRYKNKFVFYTNYQTISFPIIFISKEMTRYSIYLPSDKEIIFEMYSVNEAALLFFGGDTSHSSDNKFKLLPNE